MNKYQVICVDDLRSLLPIYKEMLSGLGYEIITFQSSLLALDYIKEHGHNIIYIFSDYSMNELDGMEFRKRINEFGEDIPFAMVTGFYDVEMAQKGMEYRISSFLKKPFTGDQLIKLVNDLGEKRKIILDEEVEMIYSFIEESYPMLEDIEELIISLEADPTNEIILNTYFRLLHTIKGTASCVGLKNLPKFAHKYEDLVVKLQKKQISLNAKVVDALLKGLDYFKFLYSEAKSGRFEINIDKGNRIFDQDDSFFHDEEIEKHQEYNVKNKHITNNNEAHEEKIGVPINVLNNFLELSGQLTVLRNTLIKSAMVIEQRYHGDNDIEIMIESLDEMHKVSSILQNNISEMRKVNLEVVYKPLRRVVRDSSQSLSKHIEFQVEGEGLKVDTTIGKVLSNSLVHMIRNSIDHGIELPEKRVLANKDKTGTIKLKTFQDGENIIVELSDDGNGLSLKRIKEKAIEKNLFSEEQLKQMSEQKIFGLIFDSGFSTAQQVSDISGRGVGMDMVKNSIESVGGKILIDSKEGKGTTFILTLPIPRSVLIIKSLMILSGESTFSIPLDEVAEVVRLESFKDNNFLHRIEKSLVFRHQDELLPLVDLNQILHNEIQYDNLDVLNIVIVRSEGFKFGIIVDKIMDIEEIVVKKMSKHLNNSNHLFMGVTFAGHGALALILNLTSIAELIGLAHENLDKSKEISKPNEINSMEFMQFNFNKSKNYGFPLHVVNRLEEIETEKIEYFGSIPLVRYRDESMPLLFLERQLKLCSVEVNLCEIYPKILNVIVVNLHNKRFGIVVDEILDIGATTASLETQDVNRLGFMGTIFIDEKTVTILDVHYLIDNYIDFEKEASHQKYTNFPEVQVWKEDEAA